MLHWFKKNAKLFHYAAQNSLPATKKVKFTLDSHIQSFFWPVFSVFSPNAGKYGPKKPPYLFIYLHFIYSLQYIKTHDLKVQLNCTAVQIIRYMHAN